MKTPENLKVIISPSLAKGETPWVRYATGNGWSVFDTRHRGVHTPDLAAAVKDYNGHVLRAMDAAPILTVAAAQSPPRMSVMDLPGWGDAVEAEIVARFGAPDPLDGPTGARGPERVFGDLPHCPCPECSEPKPNATKPRTARRASPFASSLLPLLGMLAAIGVLDESDFEESPALNAPPSDEMRDVLQKSSILHPCADGNAVLAVPRNLGDAWAAQLVEAIKADNVAAVRAMLESAGLMY